MRNNLFTTLLIFYFSLLNAQVGIKTVTPNSTLTINGSLGAAYKEVTSSTILTNEDHYISYSGNGEATITLPIVGINNQSFTGRVYKIKNLSTSDVTLVGSSNDKLRLKSTPVDNFIIKPGGYIEAVNNSNETGGTWDISFVGHPATTQELEFYSTILKIPPHASAGGGVPDWSNHTNTGYDTGTGDDKWYIISKESRNAAANKAPVMKLVYEYQGNPFNLDHLAPMLTTGVNAQNPDVFTASVMSLLNNGTGGKTRLTIAFARNDLFQESSSHWAATFNLYVLLVRKNM